MTRLANNQIYYLKQIYFLSGNKALTIGMLFVIILLSSFFDLAGIALIGQYFTMLLDPENINNNYLLSSISQNDYESSIINYGIILVIIFLLRSVIGLMINKFILSFSWNNQVKIQTYLLNAYQKLNYEDYINKNSSEYIQRIQHLVPQFSEGVLLPTLRVMSDGIVSLAIISLLAYLNIEALLIFFFILIIFASSYTIIFGNKSKIFGKKSNIETIKLIQRLNESIYGLKEIRLLSSEKYFHQKMKNSAEKFAKNKVNGLFISTMPRFLLEFVLIFFVVTMIAASVMSGDDPSKSLGVLAIFGTASLRLIPSASNIMGGLSLIRFGRNATNDLYNDLISLEKSKTKIKNKSTKKENFKSLLINDISYTYPNMKKSSLNNISLCINSGEMVGVIGKSGSGKTTLINLILGLLYQKSGEIRFNDENLSESLQSYWSTIAHIPQEIFLIDDSLKKNIALGVDDQEIDIEKLNFAINKAKLEEVVKGLPDNYETMVGERGIKLSGGQRQRIALARAFYFEKDFIILDEATSSLDNETENQIISEINNLKRKKTILIITHKHSTIKQCDKIIMLENGRIIKEGKYNDYFK
ncbi:MAG: hypothetical protein CMF54_07670 [Legionellales bacterium]|nr:hypothetical protein [Legionellales bacterium]|tara:strand:- start:2874 stop:4631 length:1758 start_codon:yes stop_codon:yes gene_type:complete